MKIRKRNGTEQDFSLQKIVNAINKANNTVAGSLRIADEKVKEIAEKIEQELSIYGTTTVEIVHDKVEEELSKINYQIAKNYIIYRYEKASKKKFTPTEEKIISIANVSNEDVSGDNANKRPTLLAVQRDYFAGTDCKEIARKILPKDIVEAHDKGLIHYHDMDYSPVMHMHNCDLINVKDMFENGFTLNDTKITTPQSFRTAYNLVSQITMSCANFQYGGQTFSLAHLAKYVDISRQKIKREVLLDFEDIEIDEERLNEIVDRRLRKEIKDGIQTYQYQILTLITSNGQTPFCSMAIDFNDCETEQEEKDLAMVIEEVLNQRIEGIPNEQGVKRPVLFPKLLYVTDEGFNINDNDPYFFLTQLAAKCATVTMQPDFISAKKSRELKDGQVIKCMGCRSFLTPYYDKDVKMDARTIVRNDLTKKWVELSTLGKKDRFNNGCKITKTIDSEGNYTVDKPRTYSRFNQGVITINLPYVALKSQKERLDFWKVLEETTEICHRALLTRHQSLLGTKAKVAPILWQWGALTRLGPEDTIDKYLTGDYSTISLGYVGLYETCEALIQQSNTSKEGEKLANKIMKFLNDKCSEWKEKENIPYSIYGTPEEATTEKFANCLKREFGLVPGVTDHGYVTNSYHVNPAEEIDAFSKITFESQFLANSKGGAVSYIEASPSIRKNIPAVISLIKHMYENILYCELNTKLDYCYNCGSQEELALIQKDGKYIFKCKICGCEDQTKLSGVRRLCGYIGEVAHGIGKNSPNANQGRLADIYARVVHI